MANPHLATTLTTFDATVHRTKNRLIAIPAGEQRRLGLVRRANNHIISYSIRSAGGGRWNHHLACLTYDNEFSIPADVVHIQGGDSVEIKIHRIIPNVGTVHGQASLANGGALLTRLAEEAGADERADGSQMVDEFLYGGDHG
jgi:hypothetical protein